jgi:hypothetical protein
MRGKILLLALSIPSLVLACSSSSTPGPSGSGGNAAGGLLGVGGTTSGGTAAGGASATGGAGPNGGSPSGGSAASGGGAAGGSPSGGVGGSLGPVGGTGGASPGTGGQSGTGCTRDSLTAAAESYVAAVEAGETTPMALSDSATYVENMSPSSFTESVWTTPLAVAFHRSLLDTETCQTFTEVIITEGGHPYVIGTRLKLDGPNISEVESLVTDEGDWLFDADRYLQYSSQEDWDVLPAEQQNTRDELIAAANAYFNIFSDPDTVVPWGTPCTRLEGGQGYTGSTCDVGIPTGITFADKRFVVDRDIGSVVGLVRFGGPGGLPDSHLFRVISGKIRYVHTLTYCEEPNCGM